MGYTHASTLISTTCFKNAEQALGKVATVREKIIRAYTVDLSMKRTASCSTLRELSALDFLGIQKAEHA